MRHSISGRSSAAATSTLPAVSLYSSATFGIKIREIGIFNTTAVAFVATIRRLSTAGTQGAGLTEANYDEASPAQGTGFDAHTGTPPTAGGTFRQAVVGGVIGSGLIFTFGDSGLIIPAGTANGIGILCGTGTGQVFDYYIDWDE